MGTVCCRCIPTAKVVDSNGGKSTYEESNRGVISRNRLTLSDIIPNMVCIPCDRLQLIIQASFTSQSVASLTEIHRKLVSEGKKLDFYRWKRSEDCSFQRSLRMRPCWNISANFAYKNTQKRYLLTLLPLCNMCPLWSQATLDECDSAPPHTLWWSCAEYHVFTW